MKKKIMFILKYLFSKYFFKFTSSVYISILLYKKAVLYKNVETVFLYIILDYIMKKLILYYGFSISIHSNSNSIYFEISHPITKLIIYLCDLSYLIFV
jgi:hypothetical protein